MQGKFFPIVLIGMSRYSLLDEVAIGQIEEDVLRECDTRMNFNTEDASVEDAFLPKTHAVMQLLDKIDIIAKSINKHLVMGDEAWTHLVEPNQSTMFHTHQDPGPPGLSFVYWVTVPEKSGDLIAIIQVDKYRHFHKIEPKAGDLVVFPTYLPHMTARNCSNKTRISISGNYYPPLDKLELVQKEPGTLFSHVGKIAGR